MSHAGAQEIRFRCAIAAINDQDTIRVFSQDTSGKIREATCRNGKWTGGTADHDVVATGILGTPIAALCREMDEMMHVFYIGEGNVVRQVYRDSKGKWYEGDLNREDIVVAPYAMMCACFVEGSNRSMRVYVQMQDNNIQEFGFEDSRRGWVKMANVCNALPGTGLACVAMPGRAKCIRLFCQNDRMDIVEHCCCDDRTWQRGRLSIERALPRTDLTAVVCGDTETKVYYIDRDNQVKEVYANASDDWKQGDFNQHCVPGSQVAAVSWGPRNECNIRVYFQSGHQVTAITEWKYRAGHGAKWEEGQRGLPPAQ
ncbi:fungal fucose-specific lectin [Aspergillus insuetus]